MSNEQQEQVDCESPTTTTDLFQPPIEERPLALHKKSFPICPKCNSSCSTKENHGGDLVRALNQVYHYTCFVCEDCQIPIAEKYFPLITTTTKGKKQRHVYCEYHHLKRIGMICTQCDQPLDSTKAERHLECSISSSSCPSCRHTVTQQQISSSSSSSSSQQQYYYYEFQGTNYCRFHYSLILETHCNGCNQAILKQFVEHINLPNQIWHPECYMIYKFWGIKLNLVVADTTTANNGVTREKVIEDQIQVEKITRRVWTDLSSFEDSSANCISDMLIHVAAGGVSTMERTRMAANQFIMHLQVLFHALDKLDLQLKQYNEVLDCKSEAKALCQKMTRFFELITIPSTTTTSSSSSSSLSEEKKAAAATALEIDSSIVVVVEKTITQELLSLVTGLAQHLKSLIRIGLSSALHLEQEFGMNHIINEFLNDLLELDKKKKYLLKDALPPTPTTTNECYKCHLMIQDTDCYTYQQQQVIKKWHPECFVCNTCLSKLDETLSVLLLSAAQEEEQLLLCCQSCCTTANRVVLQQQIHHVTLLQQYLDHLVFYLVKLSSSSSTSSGGGGVLALPNSKSTPLIMTTTTTETTKKRRKSSILRMLGTSRQQQKRSTSVHLGQIVQTTSSFAAAVEQENKTTTTDMSPGTMVTLAKTTNTSPTPPSSSSSASASKNFTNSIRRTFSTNSISTSSNTKPTTTRRKMSFSFGDLFNNSGSKRRVAEARRASVLTLDETTGLTRSKTIYLSTLTPIKDFIVRHVAVMTIQPLIIPPSSLDELIDLIEIKKKKKQQQQQRKSNSSTALWDKFITHITNNNSSSSISNSSNKTFGVPLSTLVMREQQKKKKMKQQQNEEEDEEVDEQGVTLRDFTTPAIAACFDENALIPIFIQTCIMAILQSDMSTEGVFRKNGNIRQLKTLSEHIDTTSESLESLLFSQNSIQLAALLKKYLRDLPEPLMTFSLYNLFVQCGRIDDTTAKKRLLHLACCLLPKPNRDTMLLIFNCLKWVATYSDTNKMNIPNLARVIAPNVLHDRLRNVSTATTDLVRQGAQEEIHIIEILIREADQISIVPSDLILLSLQDNVNQDVADLNSRYFINHYIQLLNQQKRRKDYYHDKTPPLSKSPPPPPLTISRIIIPTTQSSTPSPLTTTNTNKQQQRRRTSWIPSLGNK